MMNLTKRQKDEFIKEAKGKKISYYHWYYHWMDDDGYFIPNGKRNGNIFHGVNESGALENWSINRGWDGWRLYEESKNLTISSLDDDIAFRLNHLSVGCQTITLEDAHVIYEALGEWLGGESGEL